jgi:hypothetical protein
MAGAAGGGVGLGEATGAGAGVLRGAAAGADIGTDPEPATGAAAAGPAKRIESAVALKSLETLRFVAIASSLMTKPKGDASRLLGCADHVKITIARN